MLSICADIFEIAKHFVERYYSLVERHYPLVKKYYPRNHLYMAAALSFLILGLLVLPSEEGEAKSTNQLRISVAVGKEPASDLASSTLVADNLAAENVDKENANNSSAELLADYVVSLDPEPASITADTAAWQNIEIQSGDNLSAIFMQVGLTDQDLFRVLNSSDEAKVLNRLYPGYKLDFMIADLGELEQLRVLKSPLEGYLFTLNQGNYEVEPIQKQALIDQAFKVGTITDSLFMAGQREKIPAITIMEMANIFGGVIDFILDPRLGDKFSILYEEKHLDGEFIGNGEILATQYINQGKKYTAVRYMNAEGEAGYFNPNGESMRKAFLRSPLDVFKISSTFNPRRRHPILNTIRAHKGTDYAAPNGTPVRATSDGTVTWAARNGFFGNLVVVRHSGGFETKYAHLSKYNRDARRGDRVRQGDIIGYVGATGGATGPHLHYEFLMNSVHQNPRTILNKLPKAVSIDAAEMGQFRSQSAALLQHFDELNDSRIPTLNQPSAD